MIDTPKIVFTKTLKKSQWPNTDIATGDLTDEISTKGKPVRDSGKVRDIMTKFRSKYGDGEVRTYIQSVM